jgi:hypothetical protein
MSWYYDNDSLSNYYKWRQESKLLERARKKKKLLQEKEKKKKDKVLKKLQKEADRLRLIEERKLLRKERTKLKKLDLKEKGWKSGYVRQNVLESTNKARDLELCKEVYLKAKSGMTTRELAAQYNRPNNWVLRYKYTYEAYLQALEEKGERDEN